jgi:hypothetical protein
LDAPPAAPPIPHCTTRTTTTRPDGTLSQPRRPLSGGAARIDRRPISGGASHRREASHASRAHDPQAPASSPLRSTSPRHLLNCRTISGGAYLAKLSKTLHKHPPPEPSPPARRPSPNASASERRPQATHAATPSPRRRRTPATHDPLSMPVSQRLYATPLTLLASHARRHTIAREDADDQLPLPEVPTINASNADSPNGRRTISGGAALEATTPASAALRHLSGGAASIAALQTSSGGALTPCNPLSKPCPSPEVPHLDTLCLFSQPRPYSPC